ncbi:uncharacterized protein LOC123308749 [Coccinella septempunctata]|uniref:uncharacterized protein LOC123308749 n=1 Tax=Coccinella septempunctata TaxID=41139 RepID=UPI001D094E6F|nr:uncharacterized protein LOC123308749 [Coccinella septempunctata]
MMSANNVFRRIFSTRNPYQQCKIRNLCNSVAISRDTKQTSPDILMNKFKYASNTREVLDTFSQHKDVMNAKHIMQALRSVFVLQKEGRSELSTKSIISSKKFAQLCGKLKTLSGTIDSHETIEALKVVTYVGVPKNSTIVQVLLQLLKHQLNDLNLHQIIFLEFLLGHYEGVPLAEALRMALPIVFDIQLPIKMEHENIHSLREYLQFASQQKLSNKSVELILSKLLSCRDKYDAKVARSILWSLSDIQPRSNFEPLLKKNFEILIKGAHDISFNDLDVTLKKLANSYIKYDYPFFRNKAFCDSVTNYVMDKNLGFKESIYVIRKLAQMSVTNKAFIDYVSNKITENFENGENKFYYYYVLLKYLAKTDYRPKNWDSIIDKIKNMEIAEQENEDLLGVAVVLAYHQIFHENMISRIFNQDISSNSQRKTVNSYLTLYHSIKLFEPQLTPSNFKPEDFVEHIVLPKEFPLEGALFSALGGGNYVKSGLYSKEGIFIDHAIVYRKGGYPVATNFTSKFIEDQDIPEDHELVLVMCLLPEAYTEEDYLRKAVSFRLKLLEKLGYTVVPVCWESWKSLLDYEKIPYLVQNIKNKLRQDISVDSYA